MNEVLVSRHPVFDRDLIVAFYDLSYRICEEGADVEEKSVPPARTPPEPLVNALVDIGLDRLVGDKRALVNLSHAYLAGDWPIPLDRRHFAIMISAREVSDESASSLAEVLAARSDDSYTIVLDLVTESTKNLEKLLRTVDLVRIDISAMTRMNLARQYQYLRGYPPQLIANRVDTQADYQFCREQDFDYFQGQFITQPKAIRTKRVTTDHTATLLLLAEVNNPDASIDTLDEVITRDVALSFKLLRYVKSAFLNLPKKIDTVRDALLYLGLRPLRVWANLIIVAAVSGQHDSVRHQAIVRARFCEGLALKAGKPDTARFFTIGLFSTLDILLGMPMEQVLERLPLSDELKDGILHGGGITGNVLTCARDHETGRWRQDEYLGLPPDEINAVYVEAIEWANTFYQRIA